MKMSSSTQNLLPRLRISAASVAFISTLLLLLFTFLPALEGRSIDGGAKWSEEKNTALLKSRSSTEIHRKLSSGTEKESARIEPHRIRGSDESANCSTLDITVSQGPTSPLPRGIPTFSVEIINNCFTGCTISNIHLKCGWFSSDNLIDPKIFKRLKFDDCLVNDGKPLLNGAIVSFKYSTTMQFPLSVSSVVCGSLI